MCYLEDYENLRKSKKKEPDNYPPYWWDPMSYEKFRPPTPQTATEVLASQQRSVGTIEYLRAWEQEYVPANYCREIPITYYNTTIDPTETFRHNGYEWAQHIRTGMARVCPNRTYTTEGPELVSPNNI